jgi:hypothetical protein
VAKVWAMATVTESRQADKKLSLGQPVIATESVLRLEMYQ